MLVDAIIAIIAIISSHLAILFLESIELFMTIWVCFFCIHSPLPLPPPSPPLIQIIIHFARDCILSCFLWFYNSVRFYARFSGISNQCKEEKNDYGSLHLIHSRIVQEERVEKKKVFMINWKCSNGTAKRSNNNKIKSFILFDLKNRIDCICH